MHSGGLKICLFVLCYFQTEGPNGLTFTRSVLSMLPDERFSPCLINKPPGEISIHFSLGELVLFLVFEKIKKNELLFKAITVCHCVEIHLARRPVCIYTALLKS